MRTKTWTQNKNSHELKHKKIKIYKLVTIKLKYLLLTAPQKYVVNKIANKPYKHIITIKL
jgi:hypothetical protein